MESLMTVQELVDYLRVSRTTIDRWRREGMPYQKISRGVRFERESVLKWIRENKNSEK
jgi:excisionase family DNA binding protein